jgi:hypothetical protein
MTLVLLLTFKQTYKLTKHQPNLSIKTQPLQVSSNRFQLPTSPSFFQLPPASRNSFQLLPAYSKFSQVLPTSLNLSQLMLTSPNLFSSLQSSPVLFQPYQTNFIPPPTNLSQLDLPKLHLQPGPVLTP